MSLVWRTKRGKAMRRRLGTLTVFLVLGWLGLTGLDQSSAIDVEYGNQNQITVNAFGAATPYPSTIDIAGVAGAITKVTVTVRDIEHPAPSTVEVLLVGPDNTTKVVLMADVGDDTTTDDIQITFDDDAASTLPCFDSAPLSSGTFKPTNCTPPGASPFPDPAPDPPYASPALLSVFNGQNPNGTWRLYVNDPVPGNSGRIRLGWIINLSTDSPTAARVVAFGGTRYDGDQVRLSWTTSGEPDNLGFYIYRDAGQERELATPVLVAGSALQMGTTPLLTEVSYAWSETLAPGAGAVRYWLEALDVHGQRTTHGPIAPQVVGGPAPETPPAPLLSQVGRRPGGRAPVAAAPRVMAPSGREAVDLAVQRWLAGQAAVKVLIREEGWYRVCREELVAAGLDPAADLQNLRLFLRGREQALQVHSALPGSFSPGDCVEFYGVGNESQYTAQQVYWLVTGAAGGARVPVLERPGMPGGASSFLATVEQADKVVYFAGLLNGEAPNFFGPPVVSTPLEQPLLLAGVDAEPPGEATLEVALQGVGEVADTNPDHVVQVWVNGVAVGQVVFDGQAWQVARFPLAQAVLQDGENLITLQAQGGATDVSLLGYLRLSYWRRYTAAQDQLVATVEAAGRRRDARGQTLDGFTGSGIRVFDITQPARVQEWVGQVTAGEGYAVTVRVDGPGPRTLLALTEAQIKAPVAVSANTPSHWSAGSPGAELLIVTHAAFAEAAQTLQAQRQAEGLTAVVIDIADVYDEYSFGESDPNALKAFLQFAWTHWRPRPRFVVLLGDATYDYRDYLEQGPLDSVPTQLVDTQFMETASDDALADVDGDGVPELAIGRLPARTAEAGRHLVHKLVSYAPQGSGGQGRRALLVADAPEGYDFGQMNARVRALLPRDMAVTEVRRQEVGDAAAQQQIVAELNAGVTLVTYAGHGAYTLWRGDLMTVPVADGLTTGEQLAVVAAMTCLNGYVQDPVQRSLAEALLLAEGGAVAVWASSGMTSAAGQAALLEAWTQALLSGGADGRGLTLGEAAQQAKATITDPDVRRSWILLGDPSLRLPR